MKKIADHPRVGVRVQIEEGEIVSTELFLTHHFVLDFSGSEQKELILWLEQYARRASPSISLPFQKRGLTPFQIEAHKALLNLPFGQTISYRELATALGRPKAYRAAGTACGKNRFPLLIPCHRILSSDGGLGGFSGGLEIKRRLLEFEGAKIFAPRQ